LQPSESTANHKVPPNSPPLPRGEFLGDDEAVLNLSLNEQYWSEDGRLLTMSSISSPSKGTLESGNYMIRQPVSEPASQAGAAAMVADPLVWLQNYTETKDSHWREAGARCPYRPFPDKPYFRSIVEMFQREPVLFIEKSRDMMVSWLCVGLFTHAAMTTEGIEVLFQSQKEDKAFELVEYAKVLYERQDPALKKAFPLKRKHQAEGVLEFAHGGRIIGIPGGGDQIRSYHPWGLFQDEAAFMPEAGESYDHAVPVCQKIVVVSSAGPGWFADFVSSAV